MDWSSAANASSLPPSLRERDIRLRGRWLLLGRAIWGVAALVILGLDVLGSPAFFHQAQMTCMSSSCANNQISQAQMHGLLASGLSINVYATYMLVLYWIGALVYAVVASAIFWRRSDDRMALFGAFTLLVFGAGTVFGPLNALPSSNPAWAQPVNLASLVGVASFYLFFCLFPSGRFVPRWMRWVVLLLAGGQAASAIPYAPLQAIVGGPIPFFVFFALLVFAQIYRYRSVSTPRERQQTKWVVLGFTIGLGGFLAVLGMANLVFGPNSTTAASTIFPQIAQSVLLCLIPVFIGIAIARSRLWDIDAIINKALVYGSLTVLLATFYAGLIIGLEGIGGALDKGAAQQPLSLVISTLIVAALFQPLRRHIQTFIDRRFYRTKYNAERTLSTFGAALRDEVELGQLQGHLLATMEETMQPTYVSIWLRRAGGSPPHGGEAMTWKLGAGAPRRDATA